MQQQEETFSHCLSRIIGHSISAVSLPSKWLLWSQPLVQSAWRGEDGSQSLAACSYHAGLVFMSGADGLLLLLCLLLLPTLTCKSLEPLCLFAKSYLLSAFLITSQPLFQICLSNNSIKSLFCDTLGVWYRSWRWWHELQTPCWLKSYFNETSFFPPIVTWICVHRTE